MATLFQDLRYGLRMLAKNPGFTAVAVITLALGIGANTAIFSVVNAVLLRPLPYRDANRLVILWSDNTRRGLHEQRTSYPDFEDWRKESHAFEGMAGFRSSSMILSQGGETERVTGAWVSANFFSLFGVQPTLGRTFSPEEEQRGERVVVLGYGLWQRRFGSSPDVSGKTLEIDGKTSLVIGIMPADFCFPSKDNQLWEAPTVEPWWPRAKTDRNGKGLWSVIGRLKPNFTIREAQAEMSTIAKRLEQEY